MQNKILERYYWVMTEREAEDKPKSYYKYEKWVKSLSKDLKNKILQKYKSPDDIFLDFGFSLSKG